MIQRILLAACGLFAFTAASDAVTVKLQPYRAVYELELERAARASGIIGLSGLLVLEWADACDGYKLRQRMAFRLARADQEDALSEIVVETLESKDGTVFRYDVRTALGGTTTDQYAGRASLDAVGAGGQAVFTKPEGLSVDLPPGTVFPTEHTRQLIERAIAGDGRVARTVFDGADGDKLYRAIAFLGKARPPSASAELQPLLRDLVSWPLRIAFFPLEGANDVPDYEIGLRLFANGIGDDVELDYGEFTVDGELIRLEALPESGC